MRRRLRQRLSTWWACKRHRCTYYTHYLALGPAELTHESYHAAEARCLHVQEMALDWMDRHPGQDIPASLERTCQNAERRVRA